MQSISVEDRIVGCFLGGALGDAWGGPFEGAASPVRFEIPARPVLSDDTQLTLATCESILERGCVDPENIASHFVRWFREGRIPGYRIKHSKSNAGSRCWRALGASGKLR